MTVLAGGVIYLIVTQKKVAYVDNVYLFENSKVKKELFEKFEADKKTRKAILDSLKLEVETLINSSEKDEANRLKVEQMREAYFYREQKFNEELKVLSNNYEDKIWRYINDKISIYGKDNNYDYLLGANGQGSIMFASDKENISEVVLKYINDKYEGD